MKNHSKNFARIIFIEYMPRIYTVLLFEIFFIEIGINEICYENF